MDFPHPGQARPLILYHKSLLAFPPIGFVKLNMDGSAKDNSSIAKGRSLCATIGVKWLGGSPSPLSLSRSLSTWAFVFVYNCKRLYRLGIRLYWKENFCTNWVSNKGVIYINFQFRAKIKISCLSFMLDCFTLYFINHNLLHIIFLSYIIS